MTDTAVRAASPVRERILDAAQRRFYAEGIRAVSADRLIADAGVSKVTFYRHFRTKDDIVVAYLERTAAYERSLVAAQRAAHPDAPARVLRWYAATIGTLSCTAGFRGCAFLNAAAEHADPSHPVRRVVAAHRTWLTGQTTELLEQLGIADASGAAVQLMMLRDGAMVAGYLGQRPDEVEASLVAAGTAILTAAATP